MSIQLHEFNICQSVSQLQRLCDVVSKTISSDAWRRSRDLDFLFLTTLDSARMAIKLPGKHAQGKDKAAVTCAIEMQLYAVAQI